MEAAGSLGPLFLADDPVEKVRRRLWKLLIVFNLSRRWRNYSSEREHIRMPCEQSQPCADKLVECIRIKANDPALIQ